MIVLFKSTDSRSQNEWTLLFSCTTEGYIVSFNNRGKKSVQNGPRFLHNLDINEKKYVIRGNPKLYMYLLDMHVKTE